MENTENKSFKSLLLANSKMTFSQFENLIKTNKKITFSKAESVSGALEQIAKSIPDFILSDWNLQDHTVMELLKILQSQKEWKRIPVIVCVDGGSDSDIRYAKAFGANTVLKKPINRNDALKSIKDIIIELTGFDDSNVESDGEGIRNRISKIQRLVPLPLIVREIISASHDPATSAKIMADLIKKDQTITARILKIVNSSYYGFYRKIGNITHAIVVLGFSEVKNIAMAACMMQAYSMVNQEKFDRKAFWRHSIGCAYISKKISEKLEIADPDDAFVIGLLHDIGKVVLNQHFPKNFENCLDRANDKNIMLNQAEKELLTIDHAEIGSIIAESWKLPASLVAAIGAHHDLSEAGQWKAEANLVHLANYYTHNIAYGDSGNHVIKEPDEYTFEMLGIKENGLKELWNSLEINLDKMKSIV